MCADHLEQTAGARPVVAAGASSPRATDVACRTLDVVGAVLLLLLCAPLLAVAAVLIRRDSPGPVLFHQGRVGRGRRPFTVWKLRTMRDGASDALHRAYVHRLIAGEEPGDADVGPRCKMGADERVTALGRRLRRTSVDELPQLWNVLRGDMSLVGPRPPIPYEVQEYPAHWMARFDVKPGLTGLWQVSGRSELTLEEMIALDVEYVRRRSLWLNLWILVRTVPAVLHTRGAS